MNIDNPWFHDSSGPAAQPCAAGPLARPAGGTPLYDELVAALPADMTTAAARIAVAKPDDPHHAATQAPTQAAAALALFARIKDIENSDGGWPGGDVVDVLTTWFADFGIDVKADLAAAVSTMGFPKHVPSTVAAPQQPDGQFVIYLRTAHAEPADSIRSFLSALVRALGAETSAAVFDPTGDQITHLAQPGPAPR